MKKTQKFVCWICDEQYDTEAKALECEAKGLMTPLCKIGDKIKYRVVDRENRSGTVIDILLPVQFESNAKDAEAQPLLHSFSVSYLVRTDEWLEGGRGSTWSFFDDKNIELLCIACTIDVVDEDQADDAEGERVARLDHSKRTVVTRWGDFVANVVLRNPSLKDRLTAYTAKLRELGCLD